MKKQVRVALSACEFNTVLAGLRCYQAIVLDRRPVDTELLNWLEMVANDSLRSPSLGAADVDEFCERINTT